MRGGAALVGALVVVAALAGCVSQDAPGGEARPGPTPRPCEHPWPCGDGSEWPADLVAPAHPRQPATLAGVAPPPDAEVVARAAERAAFRWTLPTVDAYDPLSALAPLVTVDKLALPVPEGLFLAWTFEVGLPSDLDGRSYDLRVYDEKGDLLCSTDHDARVAGRTIPAVGDDNFGCAFGPLPPLDAPADYAIELEHESDRAGSEIRIEATMALAEPRLTFERAPVERVRVPMRDGVELDGALWRPKLPEGVRAPVVLYASPYVSQCPAQSLFVGCGPEITDEDHLEDYGVGTLLDEGYAVAIFSVRGTGASGGCYDAWGADEQQDMAEIVQWLGAQAWSNGRVGMTGISYMGTTPWEAAILQPPSLKALVVGGIISDVYLGGFTPQGAPNDGSMYFHSVTTAGNSLMPRREPEDLQGFLAVAADRACPGLQRQLAGHQEAALTDTRDEAWFAQRRLLDRFPGVTAAALVLHGVEDDNYHRYQEDVIWDALPDAPKGMVLGQWDHTTFLEPFLADYDGPRSWYALGKAWFDYWLKGLGEPPAELGVVSYQDSAGAWRATTAWPPADARLETIYLAGGALSIEPGAGAGFRATRSPAFAGQRTGNPDLCGGDPTASGDGDPRWATYVSEPLAEDVVLAGNPWAHLELASDQPGGVVSLDLYALAPDGACVEPLSEAAVDLRFHEGNMQGRAFPVGTPTPVRADLYSAAARVPAGHRLVAVLSGGGYDYKQGQPTYAPQIDVEGTSHLVLPLVEGTLGGHAPTLDYPPRPFLPSNGAVSARG